MLLMIETAYHDARQNLSDVTDEMIEKIAQGDSEAFREFYILTDKAIFGYALSVLKNKYDAEDVMQETYLKVRSGAHLYRGCGKPMAWVFTLERNLCTEKFRASKRISDCDFLEETQGETYDADFDGSMVIEALLKLLNDNERPVVMMHAVSGMKHREISQMLKIPLSTVLSRYNRGVAKLREYLETHEEFICESR